MLALLWVLLGAPAAAGESLRVVAPDGRWTTAEVRAPGGRAEFGFEGLAGCRYRASIRPGTLARPVLELESYGQVFARAEGTAAGEEVRHDFPLERDGGVTIRVGGFSAATGSARLKVETIDDQGGVVPSNRRVLSAAATTARVGELWIGEANRWELHAEGGAACEARIQPGTAGPLVVRVLEPGGTVVATSEGSADAYPVLAFLAPAPIPPGKPGGRPRHGAVEVTSRRGGGGTYGLRLVCPAGSSPPRAVEAQPAPEGATPAAIDGERFGFRLASGDIAALFLPTAPEAAPHVLEVRREEGWSMVPEATVHALGEWATARTPEGGAIVLFRAFLPGVYRFLEPAIPRDGAATTRLHPARQAGGAPLLTGTGLDPQVLAKSASAWKALGLAACAPGGDYLFVAAGAGGSGLSMRVVALDGTVLAARAASDPVRTEVPGMGPSLRFRVKEPTLARLEVSGRGWRGSGVLRRASN